MKNFFSEENKNFFSLKNFLAKTVLDIKNYFKMKTKNIWEQKLKKWKKKMTKEKKKLQLFFGITKKIMKKYSRNKKKMQ